MGRWWRRLTVLVLPLLLLGATHLLSQRYGTELPPEVIRLARAQLFYSNASLPPVADATGPQLQLPQQIGGHEAPAAPWFLFDFNLAQSARQPFWLSLQHRPEASVFLDGQLIAQSGQSAGRAHEDEDDLAVRSILLSGRRLQVSIPPSLLDAGTHQLAIRLQRPGFEDAGLSSLLLGPASQMRQLQDGRQLWQGLRVATALAGLIIGLFLLLVWLALRQEWLYGVAGVYCLLVALLLSPYLLNGAALPTPWWRLVLDLADVVSKALLLFLVARLLAWPQRWPQDLALAYAALGLPIDGWAAYQGWAWTDFSQPWPWWALGSRVLVLGAATVLTARAALRSRQSAQMIGACGMALSAWAWAYVSYFALVAPRSLAVVDINVLGYAGLIALAGFALQRRFVASLRAQAQARAQLESALAARTAELEARHRQLQLSEQQRVAAQEREHLLQEMHDGLGSQLLLARLGAENGMAGEELAGLLNDCLDEMRLTVDALSVPDGDLTLLLANLRHRMGSRLSAAGLELEWQLSDVPPLPTLRGTGGRELVRIVQEALSNIIHHAGATRVRLATRLDPAGLGVWLLISDNGRGMKTDAPGGQGLRSMRKRAQRIGAQISWASADTASAGSPGTEMRLFLPMISPESATLRTAIESPDGDGVSYRSEFGD